MILNRNQKNILASEGEGLRGILNLGYLKRIETILREKHGNEYLLCDHFDLIGGTSTGSIIDAALAIRNSVVESLAFYLDLYGKIFGKKRSFWNPLETWKFLKQNTII